jgi:CheY-like chemotaxis protein
MPSNVFVQVVGFRDVERHALNTVFRLSWDRDTSYFLWTPDAPLPAQLALIDVDSYEGAMALASPDFNPYLKMICIGENAPESAWQVFDRPLNWFAVVAAMDGLFAPVVSLKPDASALLDVDTELDAATTAGVVAAASLPPGVKVSLLVDASREHRLYLRARLALAGLVAVDDADTAEQGLALAKRRRYDLVIVNLDPAAPGGWKIIDQLVALEPNIGAVVVTGHQLAWQLRDQAERAGCRSALSIPFDPGQVVAMLQKI